MKEGDSVAGRGVENSVVVVAAYTYISGIYFANRRSSNLPSRADDLKKVAASPNVKVDSQHCLLNWMIDLLIEQAGVLLFV